MLAPQILALVRGEDQEVMGEYIKENAQLLIGTFQEQERKEKYDALRNPSQKTLICKLNLVYPWFILPPTTPSKIL